MPALLDLGTTHLGLWTRASALTITTRGRIDGFLERGEWQSPLPGVFADGGYELTAEQWAMAVVLGSSGEDQPVPFGKQGKTRMRAVACGRDAARVYQLPLIDDEDPAMGACERLLHDVHVYGRGLAPLVGRTAEPHTLVRHRLLLPATDFVQRANGLWITTPLRTALDCCQLLSLEAAVCVLDDGLRRDLFTTGDLAVAVAARAKKPGGDTLARAVAAADGRAESPGETLARLVLQPAIPTLVPQVKIRNRAGWVVARADLGDDVVRFAFELDGKRYHSGEHMVAKDRKRDGTTDGLGWRTERGTWFEVRRQQDELRARVLAAHAARRAARGVRWLRSQNAACPAASPAEALGGGRLVLASQPNRRVSGCVPSGSGTAGAYEKS